MNRQRLPAPARAGDPPRDAGRRFPGARVRVHGARIVDVLLFLGFAAMWLGFLGGLHWSLDLFSHFRWQYLALCVGAAAWFALTRRRRAVLGLCLVSFLANATVIVPVGWSAAPAMDPDTALRVVSLNVRTRNPDKQSVLRYVNAVDADVVLLMEVDSAWLQALAPIEAAYPYRLTRPRADNFGIALYSRLPLQDPEILETAPYATPSVCARLSVGGRDLMIIGTHPPPPAGGVRSKIRNAQLADLADRVARDDRPVLLIGDLNATPWSHGWRVLTRASRFGMAAGTRAWAPTWMVGTPLAIPIDHALATEPLVIARREVGAHVGSDHRPQLIEVGWGR